MIDHTQVVYASAFSAYQNVNVYPTTIPVTATSIAAGAIQNFDRTITVETGTKFAYIKIQANEFDFVSPSALRWQSFPSSTIVYRTLSVDPGGSIAEPLYIRLIIAGNQVTFRAAAFNPYGGAMTFSAFNIGVEYATFVID